MNDGVVRNENVLIGTDGIVILMRQHQQQQQSGGDGAASLMASQLD